MVTVKQAVALSPSSIGTEAIQLFQPLTDGQRAAIDYHRRGLNVFPVPSPWEVTERNALEPEKYDLNDKPAYAVKGLYTARLHRCGRSCRNGCLPEDAVFEVLFYRTNIAMMVGRLSGNLVAVDCDSQTALKTMLAEFDKRGIHCWAYQTHRGGVLLFRVAEGEVVNIQKGRIAYPDVEVWGNSHYTIWPPSVHPSGDIYTWITPEPYRHLPMGEPPPLVSIHDLAWLGLALLRDEQKKWEQPELYGLPAWTVDLSWRNRKFLAEGTYEGQRNTCITAAAYDLAGIGADFSDATALILSVADRCDPPYPRGSAMKVLRAAYRKDREPARKSGKCRVLTWQLALAFIEGYDWRTTFGRRAEKAKSVFRACVDRSRMDRADTFRASHREIGEMAGCTKDTAGAYLNQFIVEGLLQRNGESGRSEAGLYRFGPCVLASYETHRDDSGYDSIDTIAVSSVISTVPQNSNPSTPAEQDLFGRIGIISWRVYRHLLVQPELSITAIARNGKLPRSSVHYALNAHLIPLGLVTKSRAEGLYYGEAKTRDQLEALAARMNVLGRSEARKRHHRSERERRNNLRMARARNRWDQIHQWYLERFGQDA